MSNKYSIRIEIEYETGNDQEAERLANIYVKELPRMNGISVKKVSAYNHTSRKIVNENM